jgi:branched-chain amino acid transport system substrate-binding protein
VNTPQMGGIEGHFGRPVTLQVLRGCFAGRRRFALFLVLLLLAACSSSSQNSGSGKNSAPLVVGNIETLTGPLASSLEWLSPGIQAWAKWTNAHGGINGHQVDLITMDDAGSPATSVTDARTLINQDHAVAIIDSTPVDTSWAALAAQDKIPVIADLSNPTPNSYFFASGTPLVPTGNEGSFQAARKAGGSRLAFIYCTESQVCAEAVPVAKQDSAPYGIKLAYAAGVSASAPSYTSQCLAAKAAHADVLTVYDSADVQLRVAQACSTQGYSFKFLGTGLNVFDSWLSSSAVNGSIIEDADFPFVDSSNAATQAFQSAMKKYESSVASSGNFGEAEAAGWTAGQEVAAAAKLGHAGVSGSASSAEILNGLFAMHGDTLGGLAPPLTYTHQSNENSLIKCYFVMNIQDGKFVEPNGLKPQCLS